MEHAIIVKGVSKKFYRIRHDQKSHWFRRHHTEVFWGLRDISFTVDAGQAIGVIGSNGAGKSTLLRLIAGIGRPDTGSILVNGRVGGFINLQAGFRGDLSGRDNVFVKGVIAGLTRRDIAARFDEIVAFAELEEFIDNPFRTYSSGMKMRLAFAVTAYTEPDVLLIDEVLSVGDAPFRSKCLQRIAQLRVAGCTVFLVSHDLQQIRQLCDKALWLKSGRTDTYGESMEVLDDYLASTHEYTRRLTPKEKQSSVTRQGTELTVHENRFGSMEMEITDVQLLDEYNTAAYKLKTGSSLQIIIKFQARKAISSPIFIVTILNSDQQICCSINSFAGGLSLSEVHGEGQVALEFERLDLMNGVYSISAGIYKKDWEYAYDYHWKTYSLSIESAYKSKGLLCPPFKWKANQ